MDRQQADAIWRETLAIIAARINEGAFRIWFEPTIALRLDHDGLVIGVSSDFARDWIDTRFRGIITEALTHVLGEPVPFRIEVSDEVAQRLDGTQAPTHGDGGPTAPAWDDAAGGGTNPVDAASTTGPSQTKAPANPHATPRNITWELGLNEKYTFESFVIGPSNRFAHAAALAAAEGPGTNYNPLFIYGGVGLGKTHLLQAIGHYVARHSPELRVRFVTIETFTNDFINSIRGETIEGFKKRYRTNDVLLIDDIQFLENKEQTQEEFFHTFNALYAADKQIVISSDRSPRALQTLEDRLRSRFESGLTVDIQPPDLETRIAILRKKAALERITLADDEVLAYIASRVPTNIRELEGCLTRVVAYSSINGMPIDLEMTREVLKDIPETSITRITVELILNEVAGITGISVADIKGDRRSRPIVQARHIAMYLARELTDLSLPKIGERIGGRDHTTVLHAVRSIAKTMGEDRELYNLVQQLTTRIKSAR